MICQYCGYVGNDFEEHNIRKDGGWCPICEGFNFYKGKEQRSNYYLCLETKSSLNTKCQKTKLKKKTFSVALSWWKIINDRYAGS